MVKKSSSQSVRKVKSLLIENYIKATAGLLLNWRQNIPTQGSDPFAYDINKHIQQHERREVVVKRKQPQGMTDTSFE